MNGVLFEKRVRSHVGNYFKGTSSVTNPKGLNRTLITMSVKEKYGQRIEREYLNEKGRPTTEPGL
jgi:CobQ-like glutamine amidotransferase family enzyme